MEKRRNLPCKAGCNSNGVHVLLLFLREKTGKKRDQMRNPSQNYLYIPALDLTAISNLLPLNPMVRIIRYFQSETARD